MQIDVKNFGMLWSADLAARVRGVLVGRGWGKLFLRKDSLIWVVYFAGWHRADVWCWRNTRSGTINAWDYGKRGGGSFRNIHNDLQIFFGSLYAWLVESRRKKNWEPLQNPVCTSRGRYGWVELGNLRRIFHISKFNTITKARQMLVFFDLPHRTQREAPKIESMGQVYSKEKYYFFLCCRIFWKFICLFHSMECLRAPRRCLRAVHHRHPFREKPKAKHLI